MIVKILRKKECFVYTVQRVFNSTSTIDEKELQHFDQLHSKWWNERGALGPLHAMNKLRIPFIRDGLINTGVIKQEFVNTPKPFTNLKILEIGCGGGILTEGIARLGGTVIGVDASKDLIYEAKAHASLHPSLSNLNYLVDTIENHSVDNIEQYDAVIASEVLEHITKKDLFLEATVKCLKSGGSVFITTFNNTTAAWLTGIIFAEYIAGLVPKGTHQSNKFLSPHNLQRMLVDQKCRTKLLHGMFYNFITHKWIWTENTDLTYALHAVKD